jgi:hypothetical protein
MDNKYLYTDLIPLHILDHAAKEPIYLVMMQELRGISG